MKLLPSRRGALPLLHVPVGVTVSLSVSTRTRPIVLQHRPCRPMLKNNAAGARTYAERDSDYPQLGQPRTHKTTRGSLLVDTD